MISALVQGMPEEDRKHYLEHEGYFPINVITGWNDEDDTTYQEVIDAFAKAEKIARTGFDPDQGVSL